jgi:hypothetical protein
MAVDFLEKILQITWSRLDHLQSKMKIELLPSLSSRRFSCEYSRDSYAFHFSTETKDSINGVLVKANIDWKELRLS